MKTFKAFFVIALAFVVSISAQAQSLTYKVSETHRTIQAYGLPLLEFTINDVSVNTGEITVSDFGETQPATYSFSSFSKPSLANVEILKITEPFKYVTHAFITNGSRTNLTYLGWAQNYWLSQNTAPFNVNNTYWESIATLYVGAPNQITFAIIEQAALPINVYGVNGLPTEMFQFFNSDSVRQIYFPLFAKKMLAAVGSNATIELNSSLSIAIDSTLKYYPAVTGISRYEIAQQLQTVWPNLSQNNKIVLIQSFIHGDHRTVTTLAPQLVELVGQLEVANSLLLLEVVKSTALCPDLTPEMRASLFASLVTLINKPSVIQLPEVLTAVKYIFDRGDQVVFNKADYASYLSQAVAAYANPANINPYASPIRVLVYLNKNFPESLSQQAKDVAVASLTARKDPIYAMTSFQNMDWNTLLFLLVDQDLFVDDPAFTTHVLDKTFTKIIAQFGEKSSYKTQFGAIDQVTKSAIKLMKKTGIYNDAKWITPVARLYNPKIGAELTNPALYNAKIGKVNSLWASHKILLMDLQGGMTTGGMKHGSPVSYGDVGFYLGRTYPNLIDVFYLRTTGNVTGSDGVLFMNWAATENPQYFVTIALHEGGHALDTAYKTRTPWAFLNEYWYQYKFFEPGSAIAVSAYALRNVQENHAEILSYWHVNGGHWLTSALDYFDAGHPALLNQFMQVSLPMFVDGTMKDRIRLTNVDASGVMTGGPLVGGWLTLSDGTLGNMKNGYYRFTFKNELVRLRFLNGKIVEVLRTPK